MTIDTASRRQFQLRERESNSLKRMKKATQKILKDLTTESPFFAENRARNVPTFESAEILLGDEIATGQFGKILEIAAFSLKVPTLMKSASASRSAKCYPQIDWSNHQEQSSLTGVEPLALSLYGSPHLSKHVFSQNTSSKASQRKKGELHDDMSINENSVDSNLDYHDLHFLDEQRFQLASSCQRKGLPRYVMKRLRGDMDETTRENAVIDLACEAQFLRCLSHPNVVALRATIGTPGTKTFAIVLDRLSMTLNDKMVVWKREKRQYNGALRIFLRRSAALKAILIEQLEVAQSISKAMHYLHQKRIIFRDLKPGNIGFSPHGILKLFDFGLARELRVGDLVKEPDQYRATGMVGTRRYMAPEVVLSLPYGFSADVFSFSILFWELISLHTPFADYSREKHFAKVAYQKQRPARLGVLSAALHEMMESSWCDDPRYRPTFSSISDRIQSEIRKLSGGNADTVHQEKPTE